MREALGVKLFSVDEVGAMLGVQGQSIRKYIKQGKIKAVILGGQSFVTEENIIRFLQGEEQIS